MNAVGLEQVKDSCTRRLSSIGAEEDTCEFYADVMECETDMSNATYRMIQEMNDEFARRPLESAALFAVMQNMLKKFHEWKCSVAALSEKVPDIPPLRIDPNVINQSPTLKVQCFFETDNLNLLQGDELTVLDVNCQDQLLKVRTPRGDEGHVPALSCILSTPDCNAADAIERLQVHLLTSWTVCDAQMKKVFFRHINSICQFLANVWNNRFCLRVLQLTDRERIRRQFQQLFKAATIRPDGIDLDRLHSALFGLENELTEIQYGDLKNLIEHVANVDKAVLCCQTFHDQYRLYRDSLKNLPKPVRLVHHLERLRPSSITKNLKYYEMRITLDDVQVAEETIHIERPQTRYPLGRSKVAPKETGIVTELPGGNAAKHEAILAEQLTKSEGEEQRRMVVKSVRDPRPSSEWLSDGELEPGLLTLEEAVNAGVWLPAKGVYRNPITGEEQTLSFAISSGLIEIDFVHTTRSAEKTQAVGLITIRTEFDRREFTITGAIDSLTARHIDVEEARTREIIVDSDDYDGGGYYVIETTGERLSLTAAIDAGWVFVNFCDDNQERSAREFQVHTYAILGAFDPLLNTEVSFADAVRREIINCETGEYVNRRISGRRETIPVADAITQGLLRARLVTDDDAEFGLRGTRADDRKAAVVVQRVETIRNISRRLRAISAFKSAAASRKENLGS